MQKRHFLRATTLALSTLVLGGLIHAQAQAQQQGRVDQQVDDR